MEMMTRLALIANVLRTRNLLMFTKGIKIGRNMQERARMFLYDIPLPGKKITETTVNRG
jgi:hypothetical protein